MLLDLTKLQNRKENELTFNEVISLDEEVYKDANDGNRIDIRFVAGVDSYAYTNAKFNITIKDGSSLYFR